METRRYVIVSDEKALSQLAERLLSYQRIALDTETTGLNIFSKDFELVGISIAVSPHEGFYIPMAHRDFPEDGTLRYQPPNLSKDAVRAFLTKVMASVQVVYHNAAYDRLVLRRTLGIPFELSYGDDTMVALHLYDENHPLSLKEWAKTLLGIAEQEKQIPEDLVKSENLVEQGYTYALNKLGRRYKKRIYTLYPDWQDRVYQMFKTIHRGAVSYNTLYKFLNQVFGALRLRNIVQYQGMFPNDFRYFPVKIAAEYAIDDVLNTYALWTIVENFLDLHPELGKLYETIEMPVNDVMMRATYRGVLVDKQHLNFVKQILEERIEETRQRALNLVTQLAPLEQFMVGKYKLETILTSSKQLSTLLYDELGLPVVEYTKTGNPSVGRTALTKLLQAEATPRKARHLKATVKQFIEAKLQYEALRKLHSTYTDSLLEKVDENDRLHTHYNTVGTVSGRMSSSDPNMQNLPRLLPEEVEEKPWLKGIDIRKAFVADPGYVFVSADYTSMELVMCAALSQDETMIRLLNEGRDLHAYTARYAFGVGKDLDDKSFKKQYKAYRQKAKIVNFALIYGGTKYTLVKNFGFSELEASQLIAGYFKAYPGVKKWMDSVYKRLDQHHHVVYPIYGYIKRMKLPKGIPEWHTDYQRQYRAALRTCQNALIQGLSAFIVKEAIVTIDRELRRRGLDAQVLYQVHDEIGVIVRKDQAADVIDVMLSAMQRSINGVRLEAEPEIKYTMSKAEEPVPVEVLNANHREPVLEGVER